MMMIIIKGCACVNNICHSVRVWVWKCIVNGKVNIDCIDFEFPWLVHCVLVT